MTERLETGRITRLSPLRRHITVLAIACVLPVLLFGGYTMLRLAQQSD